MPHRRNPASDGTVQFAFLHGGTVLARFSLAPGDYVIGRANGCDVVIDLEGIAPRHARLLVGDRIQVESIDSASSVLIADVSIGGCTEVLPDQPISFGSETGELRIECFTPALAEADIEHSAEPAEPHSADSKPRPEQEPEAIEATPKRRSTGCRSRRVGGRKKLKAHRTPVRQRRKTTLLEAESEQEPPMRLTDDTPEDAASVISDAGEPSSTEAALREELAAISSLAADLRRERQEREEEAEALRQDLEELQNERDELASRKDPRVEKPAEDGAPHIGFLAMANKVLFRKLSEVTGGASSEVTELKKQLKQREAALVDAMIRREAAEQGCLRLSKELARSDGSQTAGIDLPGPTPIRWLYAACLTTAVVVAVGAAVMAIILPRVHERARRAEAVVAELKVAAPQFHSEALELMRRGDFHAALRKIGHARALEPEVADYSFVEGNASESLLRIDAAIRAYERAIGLNPGFHAARANLELCRRIAATRHGGRSRESQYALHRVMMEQKRLPEALRMAQRLEDDRQLLHQTWQAILTDAGLNVALELNEGGFFDLDLSGAERLDLRILEGMPLRHLKLARANISDVSPLRDLPIQRLDLSGTRVRDVSALRGMSLEALNLSNTEVTHLFPLQGMRLKELVLDHTPVADVWALRGMPLQTLRLAGTRVSNIEPLAGLPLQILDLSRTRVSDLRALQHLPLQRLGLESTAIVDVSALAGAPLVELVLSRTAISSLEPLRGSPLNKLILSGCNNLVSVEPLAACTDLERLVFPRRCGGVAALRELPGLRFLAFDDEAANTDDLGFARDFWVKYDEAFPKESVAAKKR